MHYLVSFDHRSLRVYDIFLVMEYLISIKMILAVINLQKTDTFTRLYNKCFKNNPFYIIVRHSANGLNIL